MAARLISSLLYVFSVTGENGLSNACFNEVLARFILFYFFYFFIIIIFLIIVT